MPNSQRGLGADTVLNRASSTPFALTIRLVILSTVALCALSCGGGGDGSTPPPSISVSISPTTASVAVEATQQFAATVTGTSNTAVTWSVNGTTGGNQTVGTVSTSGLYTAPQTVPSPNPVTVTATSQADSSQSASASVTITATVPVAVTVTPVLVALAIGATQQFTATVTGTSNSAVTWSVNGITSGSAATGTISNSGFYTAPSAIPSGAAVSVMATSQANPTSSGVAVVTFVGAGSTLPGGLLALPPNQSLGNNDLTNSSFESGSSGWVLGSCFSIDTTTAHSGSKSLKFTAGSGCSYPDPTGQNVTRAAGAVRSYTVQGWVMGTANNDIEVKLSVHDVTRGGDVVGESSVVTSPGTSWQQLQEVDMDLLPKLDGDTLEVEAVVTAGTTGSVWFDDIQLIEQLPLPVSAFLKYPNFRGYLWSDVPQQTIKLEVEVPEPTGMTVQATLQAEGGSVISTVTQPASATQEIDFDAASLALGTYLIQTTLLNGSEVVATYPAYRVTIVSPAFKASLLNYIDTDNFFVINGKKRFVWGAYDRWSSHRCINNCLGTTEATYLAIPGFNGLSTLDSYQATKLDAEMSILPGAGVNATPSDDQLTPWLEADASVGVGHIQITNNWVQGNAARPIWANEMTDIQLWQLAASAMLGKPGGLGYYPYDEPQPSMIPTVFAQYQVLSPGNPGSVTWGTLADPARVFRWRDTSDVLSCDPYPVGVGPNVLDAAYGATLSPPMMRTWIWTYWTEQQAYLSRPVWMVLQLYDLNNSFPTYEQMKQQAYNAIINGANGIMWWGFVSQQGLEYEWYVVGDQQPYFDFQQISGEVMGLESLLISPSQPTLVQSVSSSNVRYLVKASPTEIVIFASNVSEDPIGNVTFTLPSSVVPTAGSTVQVYSETVSGATRTLPLTNNTFTDNFNGYDVHVYIVSL